MACGLRRGRGRAGPSTRLAVRGSGYRLRRMRLLRQEIRPCRFRRGAWFDARGRQLAFPSQPRGIPVRGPPMRLGRPSRPSGRENTGRAGVGRRIEPGQDSAEGGMTFGKGHHLHLVDGSAFIFRAYHALPPLTRKSDGLPIGAVAGFCNMLWNQIVKDHGADAPTHAAVIFDKGSHTFRNDLYDLYKANRDEMPEDLRPQIPLTRDATRAFNIACLEEEGFEADDIIATLACKAREAGGRVTIVSSDKDLMQLVGDGIEMFDAMKNRRIDAEGVAEKFGVGPDRVVDVQALAGDSTDNVPGAPGIGVKTASLLINEFGSLEELLDRAEEIRQPKRRETLIGHRAQIELSKRLVQLDCDMELPYGLDDLEVREPDADTLLGFLTSMEFRTTTKRVAEALGVEAPVIEAAEQSPLEAPPVVPMDEAVYSAVTDLEALEAWIAKAHARGWVAVDTETTGLNDMTADLVGVCLAVKPGEAAYVPLAHKAEAGEGLFGSD